MLLACHQRIRSFTVVAARLADAENAATPEIASAAEAVHRYYSVALPLHEADENESVYPRLGRRLSDPGERASLQSMVDQHGPLNQVVARLLPRWAELKTSPEKLSSCAAEIRADAARLQELWREHLALEEEIVFPLTFASAFGAYVGSDGIFPMAFAHRMFLGSPYGQITRSPDSPSSHSYELEEQRRYF